MCHAKVALKLILMSESFCIGRNVMQVIPSTCNYEAVKFGGCEGPNGWHSNSVTNITQM